MRIGLFTTDFPYKPPFISEDVQVAKNNSSGTAPWGGVAEVVYNIALMLNEEGHSVVVFTSSQNKFDIIERYENVTVHRFGKDIQVASTPLSKGLLWGPLKEELDLVHGHLGTPPGAISAALYSKIKNKPLVITLHTPYNDVMIKDANFLKKFFLGIFTKYVLTPLLKSANTITTVSLPLLSESPKYEQFIPRTLLIENGVNQAHMSLRLSKEECRKILGIDQRKKVILFVGSFSAYKNPGILVNAFRKLDFESLDSFLIMVGKGPLYSELVDDSKNPEIADRVRMPGFVSEKEKFMYYQAADILVLPSLAEAFPLVLIEASAFGLPIIVSDIEVFKTLITDHYNGLFFKGGDEEDLQEKITLLLNDVNLCSLMNINAREFAKKHDWHTIVSKYSEIYQHLSPDDNWEKRRTSAIR